MVKLKVGHILSDSFYRHYRIDKVGRLYYTVYQLGVYPIAMQVRIKDLMMHNSKYPQYEYKLF